MEDHKGYVGYLAWYFRWITDSSRSGGDLDQEWGGSIYIRPILVYDGESHDTYLAHLMDCPITCKFREYRRGRKDRAG